jgi:hypothetical protein
MVAHEKLFCVRRGPFDFRSKLRMKKFTIGIAWGGRLMIYWIFFWKNIEVKVSEKFAPKLSLPSFAKRTFTQKIIEV